MKKSKLCGQVSHREFWTLDYPRKSMGEVQDAVYVWFHVSSRHIYVF